mgnify:CR=1 FL=1
MNYPNPFSDVTTFKFNKIGRNRFFYKIRGVTQDQVFILKSGKYRSSTYKLEVLIKQSN